MDERLSIDHIMRCTRTERHQRTIYIRGHRIYVGFSDLRFNLTAAIPTDAVHEKPKQVCPVHQTMPLLSFGRDTVQDAVHATLKMLSIRGALLRKISENNLLRSTAALRHFDESELGFSSVRQFGQKVRRGHEIRTWRRFAVAEAGTI
jgi:hypothetical protein